MMRKLISILLVVAMLLTLLPMTILATSTSQIQVVDELSDYLVNSVALENDGYIGIPVHINTYVKGETNSMTPVIMYIMNHGMERIGQEEDLPILTDLLDEGYIVLTLDYLDSKLAVSPEIDWSIQGIRTDVNTNKKYLDGNSYRKDYNYVLPEGCRIQRDIKFFGLRENASVGTEERILSVWNNEFLKNKKAQYPQIHAVDTIDETFKPDGSPMDFDLRLDVIYPSQPKEKPPVFMLASSSETRNGVVLQAIRPHQTGFLMRGYASVIYDHEYFPMARNDHYGYFNPYGSAAQNGVKSHTAAVRCVRYYADQFGYDSSRIGVWGHSKSSYSALLGRPHPELLDEVSTFAGFPDETYGPQPFLTYDNGEPIPSNVQCVYTSMGDGTRLHDRLVIDETVPSIIACGEHDEFGAWDYWKPMNETYLEHNISFLAMGMSDLGHSYPYGIDPDLKYDRYAATLDFFDYYLEPVNGGVPKVVYTNPIDGSVDIDETDKITVKFTAPISLDEVSKTQVIEASTNQVIGGGWSCVAGGTEWSFVSTEYKNGHVYNLVIPDTIAAENGKTLESGIVTKFKVKGGEAIYPVKDAYISSTSLVSTGSEATIELASDASTNDYKKGYIEFDISRITTDKLKTLLQFNVENDAKQAVSVYAIDEEVPGWNESTIDWDNAPANAEGIAIDESAAKKIGEASIYGAGIYEVDITDYIDTLNGDSVRLILAGTSVNGAKALDKNYDDETSINKSTDTINQCYSNTYDVRFGGAPKSVGISTTEDHTNGTGNSVKFERNNSYDRLKFYNTFKNSALTEDDLGKTYHISYWVKGTADANINTNIMSETGTYGSTGYGKSVSTPMKAGEWTNVSFDYTIDETNVATQAGMLTVETNLKVPFLYIDDITVSEVATAVSITSKEGNDAAASKFQPKLSIHEGIKADDKTTASTYVESGANADAIFGGNSTLYVNGDEIPAIKDGNKKGYIKIPLNDVNEDTEKVELVLDVKAFSAQAINVYGIDAGRENINVDNNGGSVHNWNENYINWNSAPGNDKYGDSIIESFAFGGAPIATFITNSLGKYKVDITEYAKAMAAAGTYDATIALTAVRQNGELLYEMNFDGMNSWKEQVNFAVGGGQAAAKVTLTESMNYPEGSVGKSLQQDSTGDYSRCKFYNVMVLGAKGTSNFTQEDIGRKVEVSFMAYSKDKESNIQLSLMGDIGTTNAMNRNQEEYVLVPANEWTKVSKVFEVNQAVIDGQYSLFTIAKSASNAQYLYIDDMTSKEIVDGGVEFVAKDASGLPAFEEVLGYNNTFESATKNVANLTDNSPEYSSTYTYRTGGWVSGQTNGWTNAENHSGETGGCMTLGFADETGSIRLKLYNTVESGRILNENDIGRTFKVKFWAKGSVDGLNLIYGNMAHRAMEEVARTNTNITNEWAQYEYTFSVSAEMANALPADQGAMFYIQRDSTPNSFIYVDDVEVYELKDNTTAIVGPYIEISKQATGPQEVLGLQQSFNATSVASTNTDAEYGDYVYSYGGYADSWTKGYTEDENYGSSGGSLKIGYATKAGNVRLKLYNTVENDRALTADDIGRTFKVKFYAKGSHDALQLMVGRARRTIVKDTDPYASILDPTTKTLTTDWKQYEYEFEITEEMANAPKNQQGTMFCVERRVLGAANSTIYIDNVEVYEIVDGSSGTPIFDTKTKIAKADATIESGANQLVNDGSADSFLVDREEYAPIESDGNQKSYIKFPAGEYSKAQDAILTFNTLNDATQTVRVYGLVNGTFDESTTNWNNAPANKGEYIANGDVYGNAPLTTIEISNAGTYNVDVTEFVKNNCENDITFILVADKKAGKVMLDWDFENGNALVENVDYRRTGYPNIDGVVISDTEAYEGGKSLQIAGIKGTSSRTKLLNFFNNAPFTDEDIGRVFNISGYIKLSTEGSKNNSTGTVDCGTIEKTKVKISVMSNYYGTAGTESVGNYLLKEYQTGVWTPFSFNYTVTDAVVKANGTALVIDHNGAVGGIVAKDIWMDNLLVKEIGETVGTTVEIDNSTNAPSLYVEAPVIPETSDRAESTLVLQDAISSGDFKEGDTIELRATLKAKLDQIPTGVKFVNTVTGETILGKVYKDGYDYILRMTDVEAGEYSIRAISSFADGTGIVAEDSNDFTITSGASYELVGGSFEGKLDPSTTVSMNQTIKNNTSTDRTATLILAIYTADGSLLNVGYGNTVAMTANGGTADISASLVIPEEFSDDCIIKIFTWDDMTSAMPLLQEMVVNSDGVALVD